MNQIIGFLKQKRVLSLIVLILGIGLMLFANYEMNRVANAKGAIDQFTGFFNNSSGIWDPVVKFFGGKAHDEASKYDTTLKILMISGIIMVVAGISGLIFYRKRQ